MIQPDEHTLFVSGTKFLDVPDYIRQYDRVQEKVLMGKDLEEQLVLLSRLPLSPNWSRSPSCNGKKLITAS